VTSRLVLVLALASIVTARADPQGSGSGSAPAPADDEEGSGGSGSAVVAPKDQKSRGPWLKEHLDAAISSRPALAKAKITAYAVDVSTGAELYAREADHGMNLASNAKLLTSFSALAALGGGFHWRTAAFVDDLDDATGTVKGNLYIRGRGDPTLSVADLRQIADDVVARGVASVDGALVVDTSYFDADAEPPHFSEQPKERAAFRAPVAGFGVARSAFTLIVTPQGAHVEPDAGDYVRITKTEVKIVTDKKTKIKAEVKPARDHIEVEVSGQIRPSDGSWDHRYRVEDPARFAAEVFRHALADRGVKVRKIQMAAVPAAAKLIAAHDSAQLSSVLRDMNKYSDNYFAESVLKTLGAETKSTAGPATWADGLAAVKNQLGKIGLLANTYRAENGSGLYGASEVSARQLAILLRAAHSDFRIGPDLMGSLPVGGQDGTLAKRWHGRLAQGRVRAKTGTLDKVITLAGYAGVDGGHVIAFAILVNDIPAGQRPATRAMADDMVDAMVAYLE
jgi:D-alanyl-D-alanine carboxypeptidase/D-alanyl-D-alanine-endopeptidase (penicillin-binding protein 4)